MTLPHRFPFRLVEPSGSTLRLRLTANAYWSRDGQTLGAPWLIEAAAQAAALARPPDSQVTGERLFLAGVDGCQMTRMPRAGETLEFSIRYEQRLGRLVRVHASVESDGERLGELTLTLATAS